MSIEAMRYYDEKFEIVFQALNCMLKSDSTDNAIGFIWPEENK